MYKITLVDGEEHLFNNPKEVIDWVIRNDYVFEYGVFLYGLSTVILHCDCALISDINNASDLEDGEITKEE